MMIYNETSFFSRYDKTYWCAHGEKSSNFTQTDKTGAGTRFTACPSYRVFSPMFVELLLRFAGKWTFRARIRSFAPMIHLVLFELPLGSEYFLTNATLLGIFGVMDLQVESESSHLFEALVALGALEHPVQCVHLKRNRELKRCSSEFYTLKVFKKVPRHLRTSPTTHKE